MNIGSIFKIFAFIILTYSFVRYFDTRKYINRLPKNTREKYVNIDRVARRLLVIALILFISTALITSELIAIISSCVVMYMLAAVVSELNALKEYVYLKKKMK